MTQKLIDHTVPLIRAVVIHPDRRSDSPRLASERLEEAAGLARALDLNVRAEEIVRLRSTTPATLFGTGKVEELAALVRAADAEAVIIDDALTPVQQRNLEKAWEVKVIDRTGLILEIFGRRARTKEGRLQVELARLDYERSRLVRTWTHLERQRGGTGSTGGPGETQIELDRRRIRNRMAKLRREIKDMKKIRDTQRSGRRRSEVPSVAIVGYTNAGKSSLLNALTGAGVLVENALFATLEPTTRRGEFDDRRPFVLTDTVGFVRHLPTQLVEAFRSTLEEVVDAELLVHVVDGSDVNPLAQINAVRAVINDVVAEYGIAAPRELLVVNKTDAASGLMLATLRRALPDAVFVSAHTGDGLDRLRAKMAELVEPTDTAVDVTIPYDRGDLVARVHSEGRIDATEHTERGTRITARVPVALAAGLEDFATA